MLIGKGAKNYSVPWPMDLCAGLPDMALFARIPGVGCVSHQDHDPLELLFLDSRGPLDFLATLGNLATRAKASRLIHSSHCMLPWLSMVLLSSMCFQ